MDNYIKDLNSEVFPQIPIQPKNNIPTKIYDNSKKEDD